jgi:hypothetical protein
LQLGKIAKLLLTLSALAVAFALHPCAISADIMNLPIQMTKRHGNVDLYDQHGVLKAV